VSQKDTPSSALGISAVPPLLPAFDITPLHQCARSARSIGIVSSPLFRGLAPKPGLDKGLHQLPRRRFADTFHPAWKLYYGIHVGQGAGVALSLGAFEVLRKLFELHTLASLVASAL
jgi:hypothetical protein